MGFFPIPTDATSGCCRGVARTTGALSDQDPILKFDLDGNVVKSFGAGMFSFPHGFFLDHEGYLWVTEGAPAGDRREVEGLRRGLGHQVFKLNQDGEVVMTLGEAGVSGYGPNHFNGPSGVVIAPNGEIWISDGHRGGNNRIVKFSGDGEFLLEVGGGVESLSGDPGKFNDPHDITMDGRGRVIVADRGNNRIQIFDQQGNRLAVWTQFGRPECGVRRHRRRHLRGRRDVRRRVEPRLGEGNQDWRRGIRLGDLLHPRFGDPDRNRCGVPGCRFPGQHLRGRGGASAPR